MIPIPPKTEQRDGKEERGRDKKKLKQKNGGEKLKKDTFRIRLIDVA